MKRFKKNQKSQRGIALFMVMSALALLTLLIAELTYTTQMGSRLAYNSIDNLKAYYLAKSAFKLSLVRLNAFKAVKVFLNDPANKELKSALNPAVTNQIWEMPLVFPIPIPNGATPFESDAIKEFTNKSALTGSYTARISGESTKLNLNNLIIASQEPAPAPSSSGTNTPSSTPVPSTEQSELDFRSVLEPAIQNELENKKKISNEFADTYRNVTGKDIIDAILAYIGTEGSGQSNLPGFQSFTPKKAPIYNLTELHFIPGFDDRLFDLIEPLVTVNTTPGINVNKLNKNNLIALIPELTDVDAESIITKRDDPEFGKKWNEEKEFWDSISAEGSTHSALQSIQERFKKAGLKVITQEESFRINISATVGQANKKVEAFVILDSGSFKKKKENKAPENGQNSPDAAQTTKDGTSEKPASGINLIYWKSI